MIYIFAIYKNIKNNIKNYRRFYKINQFDTKITNITFGLQSIEIY